MSRGALLRRLAAAVLVAAAVFFLGATISRNWAQLQRFEWRVDPLLLLASVAAHVAVLAWGVWVWSRVTARFAGPPVGFAALLGIWSFSNVARYIPGTVWQFVAAAEVARGHGVSRMRMLASLAVHMGLVLLSAAGVSLLTLPLEGLGYGALARAGWVLLPFLPLLVHPRVLNAALGVLGRLSRKEVLRWEGSWLDGLGLLGLQTVSWLLYGGAYWLFLRSVAPFPAGTLLPAAGVNAASFAAGWVVFFAPGGIGVREAAMTALLTPYVPEGVAAAIAVLSRLWSIAAELLLALGALALTRRRAGADPPEPNPEDALHGVESS